MCAIFPAFLAIIKNKIMNYKNLLVVLVSAFLLLGCSNGSQSDQGQEGEIVSVLPGIEFGQFMAGVISAFPLEYTVSNEQYAPVAGGAEFAINKINPCPFNVDKPVYDPKVDTLCVTSLRFWEEDASYAEAMKAYLVAETAIVGELKTVDGGQVSYDRDYRPARFAADGSKYLSKFFVYPRERQGVVVAEVTFAGYDAGKEIEVPTAQVAEKLAEFEKALLGL